MTAGGVRGIRNNNPGNLRRTDEQWDGLSATQADPEFFAFDSPEAGIRAMSRVLENYQVGHGLQTVADMVARYAPAADKNNPVEYAKFVAGELGVDPNAPIDFSNEDTATKMVSAMIRKENGANPYGEDTVRRGVRAGLRIEDLPSHIAEAGGGTIHVNSGDIHRLSDVVGNAIVDQEVQPSAPNRGRVSFSDIRAPAPWTLAMQEAQDKALKDATPGLWEGAKLAAQSEWGIAWNLQGRPEFIADPEFTWKNNQELFKEVTQGVPERYLDVFEDVHSADHARWLRQRLDQELDVESKLGRMGWTGVGLRIAAAALDPVSLGAIVVTEGMASPFIAASKVGRLTKAVMAGTTAAASTLPPMMYLADQKLTSDWTDVAHVAMGAFALGGAIRAARGGADAAEQAAFAAAAAKARARIENAILPEGVDKRIDEVRKELGVLRAGLGDEAPKPVHDASGPIPDESGGSAVAATPPVTLPPVKLVRSEQEDGGMIYEYRFGPNDEGFITVAGLPDRTAYVLNTQLGDASSPLQGKGFGTEAYATIGKLMADEGFTLQSTQWSKHQASISPAALRVWEKLEQRGLAKQVGTEKGKVLDRSTGAEEVRDIPIYQFTPDDSVGAARAASYVKPLSEAADARRVDAVDSPFTAMGAVRFDAVGQMKSSKNPLVRQVGAVLGEDAVGNADHSVNLWGASERQHLMQREFEVRFLREAEPQFKAWAKEKGLNWFQRQRQRETFFEEVTSAIRDDLAKVSPQARQVASHMQDMFEELLYLAKNPARREGGVAKSVKGFASVNPNRNYITRLYDQCKLGEAIAEYGVQNVAELFARSMVTHNPELDIILARKYANWHVQKIRNHAVDADISTTRALAGEDMDTLREILHADGVMDPGDIDGLINILKKPNDGAHTRAKHRLSIDENFSIPMTNIAGTETRTLAIKDLLVNDAEQLFNTYLRQLSGAVALARTGFSSRGEVETFLKHVRQTAPEIPGYTMKELERDIANLEFMFTMTSGSPIGSFGARMFADKASKTGQLTRMIRDYNYTRVMNQVGFAQLAEIGNIMGQLGFRTAIEAMPGFKAIWRNAKTGKLDDKLLDEMEAIWGIGTDRLRGVVMNRWDDFGSAIHPTEGKWMSRFDTALSYGKRVTSDISGMAGVNTILHRWTAKAIAHKFAQMAYGSKGMSKQRQTSLGLSDEMLSRIKDQIRTHSTTEKGVLTGRKMRQIDLEHWDDLEAAENFKLGVSRLARRVIQENDAGNMHRWMSTAVGQTLIQFRTFMAVAWAKQTLAGLHYRDWQTFASFTATSFAGGAAYIAQTYAQSIGREDRDEFLEKKLSPEAIGKASFQRAGWSSLLPLGIEQSAGLLTSDPIFDYRTTGLSTSIFGNPTFDLIDKGRSTVSGLGRLITDPDYRLSQENLRNFFGVLPFSNALGIKNVQNILADELPRRSTND